MKMRHYISSSPGGIPLTLERVSVPAESYTNTVIFTGSEGWRRRAQGRGSTAVMPQLHLPWGVDEMPHFHLLVAGSRSAIQTSSRVAPAPYAAPDSRDLRESVRVDIAERYLDQPRNFRVNFRVPFDATWLTPRKDW